MPRVFGRVAYAWRPHFKPRGVNNLLNVSINRQVVEIDQVRANAPPIPTPCAHPTVAPITGTDTALGRSRSPSLELARKFSLVYFCLLFSSVMRRFCL